MKYTEVDKYITEHNLLTSIPEKSGIYAITIDRYIVYVGKSKNMRERCK